jgi:hypothetical protein
MGDPPCLTVVTGPFTAALYRRLELLSLLSCICNIIRNMPFVCIADTLCMLQRGQRLFHALSGNPSCSFISVGEIRSYSCRRIERDSETSLIKITWRLSKRYHAGFNAHESSHITNLARMIQDTCPLLQSLDITFPSDNGTTLSTDSDLDPTRLPSNSHLDVTSAAKLSSLRSRGATSLLPVPARLCPTISKFFILDFDLTWLSAYSARTGIRPRSSQQSAKIEGNCFDKGPSLAWQ